MSGEEYNIVPPPGGGNFASDEGYNITDGPSPVKQMDGLRGWLQEAKDYTSDAISGPTNDFASWLTQNAPSVASGIQGAGEAVSNFSNQPLTQNTSGLPGPIDMSAKLFGRMTEPSVAPEVVGYGLPAVLTGGGSLPVQLAGGALSAIGGSAGRLAENAMGYHDKFMPKAEPGRVALDTALNAGASLAAKGVSWAGGKLKGLREPIQGEVDALKREQQLGVKPSDYTRDAKGGKFEVANDYTITPEIQKSGDIVVQEMPEIAAAPATKQLGMAKAKIYELNSGRPIINGQEVEGGLGGILAKADEVSPIKSGIPLTRAQAVANDPSLTEAQRNAAQAVIDQFSPQVSGLTGAQSVKTTLHEQLAQAYEKSLDAIQTAQNQAKMAMAEDLRIGIENSVNDILPDSAGIVKEINRLQGALFDQMGPMSTRVGPALAPKVGPAIDKVAGSILRSAAAPTVGGIVGGGAGYATTGTPEGAAYGAAMGAGGTGLAKFLGASPTALQTIPKIGQVMQTGGQAAQAVAPYTAGAVHSGLGQMLNPATNVKADEPPSPMAPPDPFVEGLPRDTNQWNMQAVNRFAKYALGKSPEVVGIAQGLAKKFGDALHQGDKGKLQRIIADMAKLFPDAFVPGMGIDDKLFHPDDQAEYLDTLLNGVRKGTIEPSFLARQRDSFLNKNDSAILPVEQHAQQQFMKRQNNRPPQGNQPRIYSY